MADKNRYNFLYKPELRPTLDWRSEATFQEQKEVPVITNVPEETVEDVLQDLKDLEEIAAALPAGLEPVEEIVTKLRQRAEVLKIEEELEKLVESDTPVISDTPETPTVISPPNIVEEPTVNIPSTVTTAEPTIRSPDIYRKPNQPTVIIKKKKDIDPDITTYRTKDTIPSSGTIILPQEIPFVPIGTNVQEDTSAITGMPSSFVPTTNISLSVETPKTLVQIAQESYKSDQIDLQKFYLQKMRMALQRYFHHLLGLTAELSLGDPDMLTKNYDGNSVTGISANCRHLHDTIIRSQIQRLQKARLFKKIANVDQTLVHMRSWNAAEKERERYYQEAYGDSENFIDSESNALLRQARSDYDAAYKLALYNMYKYLDSSVKLTEDILDHTLVEAKAKAKLIKEGVDIFKTSEVSVSGDINAVQNLQPKTNEQKAAEDAAIQSNDNDKSTSLTAEDIDKARNIEDPDTDFDLASSGGHYSKNDINYLININPEIYNKDTVTGREAIKAVLNNTDKYMSTVTVNDNSGIDDITTSAVNRTTEQKIKDISEGKLESLVIWN